MSAPRRKYSRTPGTFYPKRWTEEIALKLTAARFQRIEGLLNEIGAFWGDEDDYIEREVTILRDEINEKARSLLEGHRELMAERKADREEAA